MAGNTSKCRECENELCRINHTVDPSLPISDEHLRDACHLQKGGVHGTDKKIERLQFLADKFFLTIKLKATVEEGAESLALGIGAVIMGTFLLITAFVVFLPLFLFELIKKHK